MRAAVRPPRAVGTGLLAASLAALVPLAGFGQDFAPGREDVRCLTCHGKPGFSKTEASGKVLDLFVDPNRLRLSVHKDRTCADCHADVTEVPHGERPGKVDCRRCHYKGNLLGAPQIEKYAEYEESVHGMALLKGNPKAPTCQDCHGGHFILPGSDPRSAVSHAHLPQACGSCHLEIYHLYRQSVHGQALARGVKDAPVCSDCHGEHTIRKSGEESSSVNPGNVSGTCAKCHAKVVIMEKYGVKAAQVATYRDSFHGIANEFGVLKAANCSSCHTAHDILPETDGRSSVHPKNIPTTCGKCHPGANANFAKGRIHLDPKDRSAGIVYFVALGFKILTLSTLAGLFVHIGLDLYRRVRNRRREGAAQHAESEP